MTEPQGRTVSCETVYQGRRVRLDLLHVEEPDGRQATREVVCHNGSVAVLALRPTAQGTHEVLLERNYRHAVGRYVIELPAGTLDQGDESPLQCAQRELAEETGFRAEKMTQLVVILPSPGILTERLTIFVAEDLRPGVPALEPGELIDVQWVPLDEALEMIRRGRIEDAKTIVALLYWRHCRPGTSGA